MPVLGVMGAVRGVGRRVADPLAAAAHRGGRGRRGGRWVVPRRRSAHCPRADRGAGALRLDYTDPLSAAGLLQLRLRRRHRPRRVRGRRPRVLEPRRCSSTRDGVTSSSGRSPSSRGGARRRPRSIWPGPRLVPAGSHGGRDDHDASAAPDLAARRRGRGGPPACARTHHGGLSARPAHRGQPDHARRRSSSWTTLAFTRAGVDLSSAVRGHGTSGPPPATTPRDSRRLDVPRARPTRCPRPSASAPTRPSSSSRTTVRL